MLPLLFLAFLTLSVPAQGQDPCPSASGPGAEAGWAAYADNDMAEVRRRAAVKASMMRIANHQRWRSRRSSVPMSGATSLMVCPVRQGNRSQRFKCAPVSRFFQAVL